MLHFHGKLLPDVAGYRGEQVNRTAVVVSGERTEFLLGVPVAADSSGREETTAVLKELKEQDLDHKITALLFDTMATNTGMIRGACIRIEKDLGRDLLWLACRHHVCEVVLKRWLVKGQGSQCRQ